VSQPGKADTAVAPSEKKTERIIVFVLGGPGSGKGTQVSGMPRNGLVVFWQSFILAQGSTFQCTPRSCDYPQLDFKTQSQQEC